jgi:FkbM family methyltransferase
MIYYEIGVGNPDICLTRRIEDGEVHLFEANPKNCEDLAKNLEKRDNFFIYNCAIGDYEGDVDFVLDGDSSYVKNINSPTEQCADKNHIDSLITIKIPIFKISTFDKGNIDVLFIDIEGSEYFVLKHLISRPQSITIELDNEGNGYVNPYLKEILQWMKDNDYYLKERIHGDGVFHLK